jgi:hypothetical protein
MTQIFIFTFFSKKFMIKYIHKVDNNLTVEIRHISASEHYYIFSITSFQVIIETIRDHMKSTNIMICIIMIILYNVVEIDTTKDMSL